MSRHSALRNVRGVVLVAGLAVTTAGLAVLAFGASPAIAKPRVSLSLPGQVDAGAAIQFRYSSRGVSASSAVVVQRAQGTRHESAEREGKDRADLVWRTAKVVGRNRAGLGTLAGLGLGEYPLRIAVMRHGRVLAAQRRALKVYATVPLGKLLNKGQPGERSLPTGTFPYMFSVSTSGAEYRVVWVFRSPCRSLHLDWVASANPGSDASDPANDLSGQTDAASVVQESLGPVQSSSNYNSVAALDTPLVPGDWWQIRVAATKPAVFWWWYFSGTASCYFDQILGTHVNSGGYLGR